jgi:hypothetical protein
MDDMQQSQPEINENAARVNLKKKKEELQKIEVEYSDAQRLLSEKQRKVEELRPLFNEHNKKIVELDEYRDYLNSEIRKQRKSVKDTEAKLILIKSQLIQNENEVTDVRKEIEKARYQARPIFSAWEIAQTEFQKAENLLKSALEKFKISQQEYLQAREKSQPDKKPISKYTAQTKTTFDPTNPWRSGTFYLFSFVVVIGILAVLAYLGFSWYVIVTLMIGTILLLVIIGAFTLRNDKNISEKNFLKLMLEVIKQIPLLKK